MEIVRKQQVIVKNVNLDLNIIMEIVMNVQKVNIQKEIKTHVNFVQIIVQVVIVILYQEIVLIVQMVKNKLLKEQQRNVSLVQMIQNVQDVQQNQINQKEIVHIVMMVII